MSHERRDAADRGVILELEERCTIMLVTHILRRAHRVSDFIAFIHNDEIIECVPAEELLLDPREPPARE